MQTTLRTIIYDLLNIIRGSEVIDDEPISEKQIENWINQYRALFIKRDLDKDKPANPDYIQNIDDISLTFDSSMDKYRTNVDIPNTINLNNKSGLLFIGDTYGNRIGLVPESRVNWQEHKRFTQDAPLAFLRNKRIYIHNQKVLETVSIRGIFEIPSEAAVANGDTFDYDSVYPLPIDMLPALKREILKGELGIEWKAPSDDTNDANHEIEK